MHLRITTIFIFTNSPTCNRVFKNSKGDVTIVPDAPDTLFHKNIGNIALDSVQVNLPAYQEVKDWVNIGFGHSSVQLANVRVRERCPTPAKENKSRANVL